MNALRSSIEWRDLTKLNRFEIIHELLLSAPWLILSLIAASAGWYVCAFVASFMFFLAGLRQVHNAFHRALGVPRWLDECLMLALSVLMLGSMHAVQINHLRHHRHCMADDDVESMGARLSALGAILLGPRYPVMLHVKALELATPRERRWIRIELAANLLWIAMVFGVLSVPALRYHVLVMALGQCFTAFFAVWTTHHDCEPDGLFARTIRNRVKATLTYNMFYHFEHHLFPKVPTCKLPELARRLDRAVPALPLEKVY